MDIKDLKTAKFKRRSVTDIRKDLIRVLDLLLMDYIVLVTVYNKGLGYLLPVIDNPIQITDLLKTGKDILLEDFKDNPTNLIDELFEESENGDYLNNYYRTQDVNHNVYYFIPMRVADKLGLPQIG